MLQKEDSKISMKENVWNKYPFLVFFLSSSSYYPSIGTFILHSKTAFSRVPSMFLTAIFLLRKDLEDFNTSNYFFWYFTFSLWLLSVVSLFKLIKAWTIIHFQNIIIIIFIIINKTIISCFAGMKKQAIILII